MQLHIYTSYADLSAAAADHWQQILSTKKYPFVCVASGDSPAGLYRELVARKQAGKADFSKYTFLGLDEWLGMNGKDQGSCRYHLDQQFFDPLQQGEIHFFDGRAADPQQECEEVETLIQDRGPLDIVILGLGLNGHIGMNEPGTDFASRTHIAELDAETVKVGQKYFTTPQELKGGLTLGIATILDAAQIFLIVSGAHKAAIVKQILEAPVGTDLPATALRNHPGAHLYLDQAAASALDPQLLSKFST